MTGQPEYIVFCRLSGKNEIDTWPIIRWLWAQKQRFEVVVPITDFYAW